MIKQKKRFLGHEKKIKKIWCHIKLSVTLSFAAEPQGGALEECRAEQPAATAWFALVVKVYLDVVNTLELGELMIRGRRHPFPFTPHTHTPSPTTPAALGSISDQNQNAQSQRADRWDQALKLFSAQGFFVTWYDFFSKVPLPTFHPRPRGQVRVKQGEGDGEGGGRGGGGFLFVSSLYVIFSSSPFHFIQKKQPKYKRRVSSEWRTDQENHSEFCLLP